jgi:hypothetical protein
MCKEPLYHYSHYIHANQWQGVFLLFTLVVPLWRHPVSNIFETHYFILIPIKIYFHGVKTTLFYMFTSVPKKLFQEMTSWSAIISIEAMLNEDCNYEFLSSNNAPIGSQETCNNDMEASWALSKSTTIDSWHLVPLTSHLWLLSIFCSSWFY